jgi:hypothetical protein
VGGAAVGATLTEGLAPAVGGVPKALPEPEFKAIPNSLLIDGLPESSARFLRS